MTIKSPSDKESQIAELRSLLSRLDLTPEKIRQIEQEIRNIGSGFAGEKEAALYIDEKLGESRNWAVIHDLRLEYQHDSAQIDHLIINRLMEILVCETKRFSEGITINEHGECSSVYKGEKRGIPSPFVQNQHHILFLRRFLEAGVVKLPTRLGFPIKPSIKSLVLIATRAVIERPKAKIPGIDTLIKSDQFGLVFDQTINRGGNLAKVIGRDALIQFAHRCATNLSTGIL
jgi:hypothetical protein